MRIEPSREAWSISGEIRRMVPAIWLSSAGQRDLRLHAGRKARQGRFGDIRRQLEFAADGDAEQRPACRRDDAAERGVAREHQPVGRRAQFGLAICTRTFCICASITPSCASRGRQRLLGGIELGPGAVRRVDRIVELRLGRDALLLQRLGAVEPLAGLPHGDLGVADLRVHLRDVGLGLGAARLHLRKLGVEHRAVEHGEHVALLHDSRRCRR